MVNAPSSLDPSPWLADSLQLLQTGIPEPAWTMTGQPYQWDAGEGFGALFDLHPWDIVVDIDARRVPIGTARFKLPASEVAAHPYSMIGGASTIITLKAGWKRGPDNVQPIFRGWITDIEVVAGVATCSAVTMDQAMASARLGSYEVPDTYTTLAQVMTNLAPNWSVTITPPALDIIGTLPTPTAGQLAGFRALNLGGGSWYDGLSAAALSLGQWLRGSLTGPGWLTLSARYDGGTTLDLNPFLDADSIATTTSLDDFAAGVNLNVTWGEAPNQKTATNFYLGVATDGLAFSAGAVKDISLNYRPPGGVLSNTDPIGTAFAQAYAARRWRRRGTGRAVWWLQPRGIVTIGDKTGQIDALNFNVDAGEMTVTIRPTSAY